MGWAEGYGAFTVDASLREVRMRYIMNQKVHHATDSFVGEYMDMLHEAGIEDNTGLLGDEQQ